MAATDTVHGWASHETWLTHLHLTNSESSQAWVADLVAQALAEDPEHPRAHLAFALRTEVTDGLPDVAVEGLLGDLVLAALARVDWHQLAEAFLELEEVEDQ